MLRSARIAALALAAAAGANAGEPPATPGSEPRPAFLELRVNQVPGAASLVLLAPDGDVWVAPDDLSRSGLAVLEGARQVVEGRTYVSLRSLAPELRFEVDERAIAVRITAGSDLLRRSEVELRRSPRPADLETPRAPSAFLNWSGRADTDDRRSAYGEAGMTWGTALLAGSVSAATDTGLVRGLTSLTVDDPRRLVRVVAGDALVRRDALGGAPLFAGLTVARELSLDPYLVRAPLPHASAFAATPSTVEVWLNGTLVRTEMVAPGTYDLTHLPVTTGANDLAIVVRDAFGRSETLDVSHYQAQGLLARGLHDWAWHAGALRERFGTASFEYGSAVVAARHRYGLTDSLTVGAAAEATRNLGQASLSVAAAVPWVGEIEASLAGSSDERRTGAAGLLAWSFTRRRISFGADGALVSPEYANTTLRAADPRDRWRASAFVGFPVARETNAVLRWIGSGGSAGTSQHVDARTSFRLAPTAWLVLSGAVDDRPGVRTEVSGLVQIVVAVRDGSTIDAGAQRQAGANAPVVGAQRPLPPGPGIGYRVRGDGANGGNLSALLQAQPSFGRFEASYDRLAGTELAAGTASGGLVLVGERLFATRPVEQSFAVVRVPGVAGVRAYLDHNEMGRTDSGGDLLVPGLLPYYASRLAIADEDVPAEYRVGRVERVVAVPARAGAVVRFDVVRLSAVEGWLRLSDRKGSRIPAYGTLEVDVPGSAPRRSPIGDDGAFWLEDLPAGTHAARIYWQGEICEFGLSVPAGSGGVIEVGTIGCEPRGAAM